MDPMWRELEFQFQQGWTWFSGFIRGNPFYAMLVAGFVVFLVWMFMRPELK